MDDWDQAQPLPDFSEDFFSHDHSDQRFTGPQQMRKQPTNVSSSSQVPQPKTFNPAVLLNPKAAVSSSKAKDEPEGSDSTTAGGAGELGSGNMIERLNGVIPREDALIKKRKIQVIEPGDSDEERKKMMKSTSNGIGNGGGVISEHLREERRKDEAQATPIDLTLDDDNDDEIQVLKDDGNEEVCLGVLRANASVHRIPTFPASAFRSLGKDHWPRMKVTFRRETSANMIIDLLDPAGNKFGNMDAQVASALCSILQGVQINRARFKIYLASRPKKSTEVPGTRVSMNWPTEIIFYAPRRLAKTFNRFLNQKNLWLSKPIINPGKEYVDGHEMLQIMNSTKSAASRPQGSISHVTRTVEEMRREANSTFDTLAKSADAIPEKELTSNVITTPLMPHQKQALHFLTEHERSEFVEGEEQGELSLWKSRIKDNGQQTWYHVVTGLEVAEKPKPMQGGILADMMGLGKTLSILALVAETRQAARDFYDENDIEGLPDIEDSARSTLIICPKSVMANWQEQISIHAAPGKMRHYAYHGAGRTSDIEKLTKFDVVITTYNTAAAEFSDDKRQKKPLASIKWFRIVLDEAHAIRTRSTKVFKACVNLQAERRWAVTGTPIQNGLDDLGALVRFLRVKPFDNAQTWAQYIIAPLKSTDPDALQHLQILVGSIGLRRLKNTIELPDRTEVIHDLPFSKAENVLYKQFAAKMNTVLRTMVKKDSDAMRGKAYAHVLKGIGWLRAICAHGREMMSEEDMQLIQGSDEGNAIELHDVGDEPDLEDADDFIPEKLAYDHFQMMQDSSVANCLICDRDLNQSRAPRDLPIDLTLDDDEDESATEREELPEQDHFASINRCLHLTCEGCREEHDKRVSKTLTADGYYTCYFCSQYIRTGLFPLYRSGFKAFREAREAVTRNPRSAKWDENTYSGPHTKVKQLIADLRESERETADLPDDEPPIRSVVFSGWTSYLDLIEYALRRADFGVLRLDGTMSVPQRRTALEQFKTDDTKTVLLVSIKAGGQGLNLTAASKVYVMEPQFNPGVERQAVDRVHRMGQTRPVYIKHYIMQTMNGDSTIEGGIRTLQKMKEDLADLATERKKRKADDSKELLRLVQGVIK